MNPLREIRNSTTRGKWIPFTDFMLLVGWHLKLAGTSFANPAQLVDMVAELLETGFFEHDPTNVEMVRVKDMWYDAV